MIIKRIDGFFEQDVSFSQETTLCGKSILRNIQKAIDLGYFVEMHYIGLDNPETAKARVKKRVKQGGKIVRISNDIPEWYPDAGQ